MDGAVAVQSTRGMVVTVDRQASAAGAGVLADGGSAVDAAVAANAVLAVVAPHLCGMGGDLFALVHHGTAEPAALNATGRAGAGADLDRLRSDGHTRMPTRQDIRSVTVPGCVDGWLALHDRFGRLSLDRVLGPAIAAGRQGFVVSPTLAACIPLIATVPDVDRDLTEGVAVMGATIRRPRSADAIESVVRNGRSGFYGGRFGEALMTVGAEEFASEDLEQSSADWVEPISIDAWDHVIWTMPPNSQGYLALAGAAVADALGGWDDPVSPAWPHLLIETAKRVGIDRPADLHEAAVGAALLDQGRLSAAAAGVDRGRSAPLRLSTDDGDTTYLAAVDQEGLGVSLIQSNAQDFGSHLTAPGTGIFLHNRGIGFSVDPDHPAAYGPGRRPPHTLSPLLVTRRDGSLRSVLGTMGGDSQPQILLQILTRLLRDEASPVDALAGARWVLRNPDGESFDTWTGRKLAVVVEDDAPPEWASGLGGLGHVIETEVPYSGSFGHAQIIDVDGDAGYTGVADPRALAGAAHGL